MRARALSVRPASDAEVFFTSVFSVTGVLIAGELLFRLLQAAASSGQDGALIARVAPLTTVRLLYASFVLLPAGLAFLAIGLPFCLRTLVAAVRRRVEPGTRRALLALGACAVLAGIEIQIGRSGFAATSLAAALAAWRARATLARVGAAHGFKLLGAGGAAAAGLAWYEHRLLAGAAPSMAVAPTLLIAATFFASAGLVTAGAGAARPEGDRRIAVALCWVAAIAWLTTPLLRSRLAASPAAADRLELWTTAAAAFVLCAAAVARRWRR